MRICRNTDESADTQEFENGEFEVKDMKMAECSCEQLKKLRKYFLDRLGKPENTKSKINSAFLRGFLYISKQPDFSFEKFYKNIKKYYPKGIPRMDGVPAVKTLFIKINNIK